LFKQKKEKIALFALFGGSFDPPHFGHLEIIKKSIEILDIDKLIVVPTYLNPFKKRFFLPPKARFEKLRKLINEYPKVEVSNFEINQKRAVPTIETLEHLEKKYNPKYIIIGADNLENIEKWKNFKELNSKVIWVIATRDGYSLKTKKLNRFKILKIDAKISSTEIREKYKI